MYDINSTLLNYLNRCFVVMQMCIDNKTQLDFLTSAKQKINNNKMKIFEPTELQIFDNIAWVKDTKLAKEFQEICYLLGFKKISNKLEFQNQYYFPMEKLYDDLGFKFGFMYLAENTQHPNYTIDKNELYFIISGTANWYYNNQNHDNVSAGNIIFNPINIEQGVKSGYTPLLCLYFNWS